MTLNNKDRKESAKASAPTRGRRFRIDRLEERVAPKKGGGSHKCVGPTDSGGGNVY